MCYKPFVLFDLLIFLRGHGLHTGRPENAESGNVGLTNWTACTRYGWINGQKKRDNALYAEHSLCLEAWSLESGGGWGGVEKNGNTGNKLSAELPT